MIKKGGLRTKGYRKNTTSEKPLLTVVTVVYNGEKHLEETILSVINQTYENIEYILIDGGSTDNTVDIIRKYEDSIDFWISEKDQGIYDAMNKASDLANGKWINYMNCGDTFCNKDVIKNIQLNQFSNYSLIYGNAKVFSGERNFIKLQKPYSMNKLNLIIFLTGVVCHQAVIYNTKINFKFPKKYKLKGELYSYFAYLNHGKTVRLDVDICNFFLDGAGKINKEKNYQEAWSVLKDHVGIMRILYTPLYLIQKIRSHK